MNTIESESLSDYSTLCRENNKTSTKMKVTKTNIKFIKEFMKKNGKNYLCYISVTSFLSENQFYKTNEYLCLFCIKRKYARKTQLSIQYPHRSFNVRPSTIYCPWSVHLEVGRWTMIGTLKERCGYCIKT